MTVMAQGKNGLPMEKVLTFVCDMYLCACLLRLTPINFLRQCALFIVAIIVFIADSRNSLPFTGKLS